MTNLQTIREKCIEANPSILDLVFGCIIENKSQPNLPPIIAPIVMKTDDGKYIVSSDDFGIVGNYAEKDIKILGHPIRLADVLNAIDFRSNTHNIDAAKALELDESAPNQATFLVGKIVYDWNLSKDNLEDQSEETLEFISNLLKS